LPLSTVLPAWLSWVVRVKLRASPFDASEEDQQLLFHNQSMRFPGLVQVGAPPAASRAMTRVKVVQALVAERHKTIEYLSLAGLQAVCVPYLQ